VAFRDEIKLLLIENDRPTLEVFEKSIRMSFPLIDMHTACTTDEAIRILETISYDVVVCDRYFPYDYKTHFVDLLRRNFLDQPLLFVITGDTDVTVDSFSRISRHVCLKQVMYKPIDLTEFAEKLQYAIDTLRMRHTALG
jgi:response regulator of citrate/malate metabolism